MNFYYRFTYSIGDHYGDGYGYGSSEGYGDGFGFGHDCGYIDGDGYGDGKYRYYYHSSCYSDALLLEKEGM